MFSERDEKYLKGVHPHLIAVFKRFREIVAAEKPFDFDVMLTCGVRTLAEQRILYARKATRTMKSRHIPESNRSKMAEAIDVAAFENGKPLWDWPLYARIADLMKRAAREIGIPIVWGGDWKSFKDGPHFELNRKDYPA